MNGQFIVDFLIGLVIVCIATFVIWYTSGPSLPYPHDACAQAVRSAKDTMAAIDEAFRAVAKNDIKVAEAAMMKATGSRMQFDGQAAACLQGESA